MAKLAVSELWCTRTMSPSRQSLKLGTYVPGQAAGIERSRWAATKPAARVDGGRIGLSNSFGAEDSWKSARDRANDALTLMKRK